MVIRLPHDEFDIENYSKNYPSDPPPLTWDPGMYQMPIDIITREMWGAVEPKGNPREMNLPIRIVYYTYTDSDQCNTREECSANLRALQQKHMENGHEDIHFNWIIGGDGNVYEGAGWNHVYDPKRPEYDDDDKCAIAWIRHGEDDEDEKAQKLIWRGYDFLDWAYPMVYLY
ncbi:peptidoglycan-recognition protein LF-like [Macrosteles quadrilineatus]|uniref:peptidoglycan-recognition protein LF-like n=1 Tax=Macrosteles quadrilineatus TaxID=74068 RepID=UPI0023E1C4A6|nr:peptidoglycan-recognition protein LF-like [Macrosteles quadrilineatus]